MQLHSENIEKLLTSGGKTAISNRAFGVSTGAGTVEKKRGRNVIYFSLIFVMS